MISSPEKVPEASDIIPEAIAIGPPQAQAHPLSSHIIPSQQPNLNTQACYPWENNSCWLDASLQLLFVALSRNFSEFSSLVQTIEPSHPLRTLHSIFEQRLNLRPDQPNCSQILKRQRNDLRQQLIELREARNGTSFEPLMVRRDAFL